MTKVATRDWAVATKRFEGKNGKVEKLIAARVEWKDGKMQEVPGSEFEMKADLVLLAMGFTQPVSPVLDAFGVDKDARGNVRASTEGDSAYYTSVRQGVRRGRHAPRPVAGGVGDSRRPPVRALGRCVPDGSFGAAALNVSGRVSR